jgi:hypothetical protein
VSVTHIVSAVIAMADTTPPSDIDPVTGKGPEWGKAAPIGLLVILLMGIATFFLLRSMTRKIKSVPASFDPPEPESPVAAVPDDAGVTGPVGGVTEHEQAARERTGPESGGSGLVDERSR